MLETDFLVIGAGVAGLRAAIDLAEAGRVLVVAKDSLRESSSEYAQGGIAVALSDDDDIELHEADTLKAGDGLSRPEAVRALVEGGPAAIQELIEWGLEFDKEGARLAFAREGAHSRSRVLHSRGDSTGREIAHTLYQKAASLAHVEFRTFSAVAEILVEDGRTVGAVAVTEGQGDPVQISARAVMLATGGLGRVYLDTTNPDIATGDGVAMGWRAGARISDMEFVQFHPTALKLEGAPRFLLSEALRGEGAHLLNSKGERFMQHYHPLGELAPRDAVSRAIVEETRREESRHAWLDLSGRGPDFARRRFPRIHATCLAHGIDLDKAPAPVYPAAHYAMGGVDTDLEGRTSAPGLFAAGECACTGVHGANRLASNSLLEGVVFGARAGRAMREEPWRKRSANFKALPYERPDTTEHFIRKTASTSCGILRDAHGLETALDCLKGLPVYRCRQMGRDDVELASLHLNALLIATCALARRESRGAHYRIDYPEKLAVYQKHSFAARDLGEVAFA